MPSVKAKTARGLTPLRVGDKVKMEGHKETFTVSGIVPKPGLDWYRLAGYPQDQPRHKLRRVGKATVSRARAKVS